MSFDELGSFYPQKVTGNVNQWYTTGCWFNNNNNYVLVGGSSVDGSPVGSLCSALTSPFLRASWYFGARLSYKPLA